MGSAISKSLAKGNFRLLLKANNTTGLNKLVADIKRNYPEADVEAAYCGVDASWEADIIILATPYEADGEIASKIREVANQKIVVSISNPLSVNYDALITPPDTSAGEELQKLLPNSKVIKAFNTTFAADFASPIIDDKQVDAFIAGNDQDAVDAVSDLVSTAGFNAVHAGDLSVSRTLENMQLLMIRLGMKNKYNWHAGWKILHNNH